MPVPPPSGALTSRCFAEHSDGLPMLGETLNDEVASGPTEHAMCAADPWRSPTRGGWPNKTIAHRYVLANLLGVGGMGAVWAATDIKLDRPVAVKLLRAERADVPSAQVRFEREAKAVAQLRSPHIVEIHDYGIAAGQPFMVMERLEGSQLSEHLREGSRLSLEEVTQVTHQVAKALACAHEAGIVHRDLKPGNIFLARAGDELLAKVFDFGIAKVTRAVNCDMTEEGALLGTPSYMSPEQVQGSSRVDHRSDLWALAVIVYNAVTLRRPFRGDGYSALLTQICMGSFKPATSIRPSLPPAIDGFFERALAKEPDARYGSARAMAEALAAIADVDLSLSIAADRPVTYEVDSLDFQPSSCTENPPGDPTLASAGTSGDYLSLSFPHLAPARRRSWRMLGAAGCVLAVVAWQLLEPRLNDQRAAVVHPPAAPTTAHRARLVSEPIPTATAGPSATFAPVAPPAPTQSGRVRLNRKGLFDGLD